MLTKINFNGEILKESRLKQNKTKRLMSLRMPYVPIQDSLKQLKIIIMKFYKRLKLGKLLLSAMQMSWGLRLQFKRTLKGYN